MNDEHSRPLRLGAQATERLESELRQHLESAHVALSLDPALPGAELTARVLLCNLRRLPGKVILLRAGLSLALVERLEREVAAIDPTRPLEVLDRPPGDEAVALHIGTRPNGSMRVVPDGYGTHIARDRKVAIRISRPANALGSIYAAAVGAAEAFKDLAGVLPHRRLDLPYRRWCPLTLSNDLAAAPALPHDLQLDAALIGVGAIGTATSLILSELEAGGRLVVIDPEHFGRENVGTYSLGGAREAEDQPFKVNLATGVLARRYEIVPFCHSVEKLTTAIDQGEVPWPADVLVGVDSIEGRHAAQRLWPDHLIDAATGDTMLGLSEVCFGEGACLQCFFPVRRDGPGSAERLATATGLALERARRGDEPLEEGDLTHLTPEWKERLQPHLGTPVCGLAQALGLTTLSAGDYQPAVPFVSQQAACLGVGRLLARLLAVPIPGNFVQYDALIGPEAATCETRRAVEHCYCRLRRSTIDSVRTHRRSLRGLEAQ